MVSDEHVNTQVWCVDAVAREVRSGALGLLYHNLTNTALVHHVGRSAIWPIELVYPDEKSAKAALKVFTDHNPA